MRIWLHATVSLCLINFVFGRKEDCTDIEGDKHGDGWRYLERLRGNQ